MILSRYTAALGLAMIGQSLNEPPSDAAIREFYPQGVKVGTVLRDVSVQNLKPTENGGWRGSPLYRLVIVTQPFSGDEWKYKYDSDAGLVSRVKSEFYEGKAGRPEYAMDQAEFHNRLTAAQKISWDQYWFVSPMVARHACVDKFTTYEEVTGQYGGKTSWMKLANDYETAKKAAANNPQPSANNISPPEDPPIIPESVRRANEAEVVRRRKISDDVDAQLKAGIPLTTIVKDFYAKIGIKVKPKQIARGVSL